VGETTPSHASLFSLIGNGSECCSLYASDASANVFEGRWCQWHDGYADIGFLNSCVCTSMILTALVQGVSCIPVSYVNSFNLDTLHSDLVILASRLLFNCLCLLSFVVLYFCCGFLHRCSNRSLESFKRTITPIDRSSVLQINLVIVEDIELCQYFKVKSSFLLHLFISCC
jgi:hypothetical protein